VQKFAYGVGPRDLFTNGFLKSDGDNPFFLSDGDLDYSSTSDAAFGEMKRISDKYPWFPKVGLALPLTAVPNDTEGHRIRKWEKDNWKVKFSKDIFLNGVDTTIAFYPRREQVFYYRPSLRLAGNNSASHYPWLERQDNDEARFYSTLARTNISSTAAGDVPTLRYRVKHQILITFYYFSRYPLKLSKTGVILVKLLTINGTIKPKQN
jgi:hypothetical protein